MNPTRVKYWSRAATEMAILLGLCLFGGKMAAWFHWPIPGGVIGLGLLLLAFAFNLVKPASLQLGAGLLMAEMLLFFIPALMSMLDYGTLLRQEGLRIGVVIGISTLLVMLVTAFTVDAVCRWKMRHDA